MLTELQQITLCDTLRTAGLKERQIEDILLLLRFKPQRVQLAFYYRAQRLSQEWIAGELGVSQQQISWDIDNGCRDINLYLNTTNKSL